MSRRICAFTLIELLVVITIIVVLLALLTPALDKAITQAELAVCAANVDGQSTSATMYVMDNRRAYPFRPTNSPNSSNLYLPSRLTDPNTGHDLRLQLNGYMAIKQMLDPFSEPIVLEDTAEDDDTFIDSTYYMWFGYKYANNGGMQRLGQRVQWGNVKVDLLVSDYDFWDYATLLLSNHPDDDGVMTVEAPQDSLSPVSAASMGYPQGAYTWSRWVGLTGTRGMFDLNYGRTDGSVERVTDVAMDDDRFERVPLSSGGGAAAVQVLSR